MKKRVTMLAAALCLLLGATTATASQNNYGCGLGAMIWEDSDGLVYELFAVGTNAFLGSQVFGISSGTSNCEKPESLFSSKKVNTFVADNMDHLAGDMAQGDGEYLETLAILLEIEPGARPGFYEKLQANFSAIYPNGDVTHEQVIANIAAVM